jgi:hypothetical protein
MRLPSVHTIRIAVVTGTAARRRDSWEMIGQIGGLFPNLKRLHIQDGGFDGGIDPRGLGQVARFLGRLESLSLDRIAVIRGWRDDDIEPNTGEAIPKVRSP